MKARTLLMPLLAGPAAGLLLYGILRAADPGNVKDEPWLLHFRAAGLETHLYRISTEPKDRVDIVDWRAKLGDPGFKGSRLLTLDVGQAPLQILEVPSEELAKELLAVRKTSRNFTIIQEGRTLCVIRPLNRERVDQDEADRIVKAFREKAKATP